MPIPASPRRRARFMPLLAALIGALVLAGCSATAPPKRVPAPALTIEPANAATINPRTPITVRVAHGTLTDVTVTNTEKGNAVRGELSPDAKTWRSTEPLGYAAHYDVLAHARGADGKPAEQRSAVGTVDPAEKFEANLIPSPDAVGDDGIGVGQPIVFQFTKPVQDKAAIERTLEVHSDPVQPGAWHWIDDENVHYRPKEFWKPGTTIHARANVYGADLGGGVLGGSDTAHTYRVHDAMIARADGKSNQMQIFRNGALINTMPISMGKKSSPTHAGTHVVSEKRESMIMDSCTYGVCDKSDPDYYRMRERWSVRVSNSGEFVHENPASVGSQGSSNVSHGCINLNGENARWFFRNFGYGDVVEVTNSGGPELPVWDRYGDWSMDWQQWQQGSALK